MVLLYSVGPSYYLRQWASKPLSMPQTPARLGMPTGEGKTKLFAKLFLEKARIVFSSPLGV